MVRFLAIAAVATSAHAATSFRIESLFSHLDGSRQYIVLRETAGRDGEHALGGVVLRATGGGTVREFTIPKNLYRTNTAGKAVLIATSYGVPTCCAQQDVLLADGSVRTMWFPGNLTADYQALPERFLSVDGGTVEIVGVDAVTHGALPLSGDTALDRSGQVIPSLVHPFWAASFAYPISTLPARVVSTTAVAREYYHAGLDRHLITARAQDIAAIEGGAFSGWTPVENAFTVDSFAGTYVSGSGLTLEHGTVPVCRYYLGPPRDTHFYAISAAECAAVGAIPGAILESDAAFYARAPDPQTGACGLYYPIYRLWNGRADAGHRWTASRQIRDASVAQGWIPEGDGPLGVAFCATLIWDYWF